MLIPCGKHVYFITQYGCMQDPFKSTQHCVTLIALPNVILLKKNYPVPLIFLKQFCKICKSQFTCYHSSH